MITQMALTSTSVRWAPMAALCSFHLLRPEDKPKLPARANKACRSKAQWRLSLAGLIQITPSPRNKNKEEEHRPKAQPNKSAIPWSKGLSKPASWFSISPKASRRASTLLAAHFEALYRSALNRSVFLKGFFEDSPIPGFVKDTQPGAQKYVE